MSLCGVGMGCDVFLRRGGWGEEGRGRERGEWELVFGLWGGRDEGGGGLLCVVCMNSGLGYLDMDGWCFSTSICFCVGCEI